ncbi:hypothetical protein ABFY27_12650 [Akkermansia massiliensis]
MSSAAVQTAALFHPPFRLEEALPQQPLLRTRRNLSPDGEHSPLLPLNPPAFRYSNPSPENPLEALFGASS